MWAFHSVVLSGVRSISLSHRGLRTRSESKPLTFSKEVLHCSHILNTQELIRWSKTLRGVGPCLEPLVMAWKALWDRHVEIEALLLVVDWLDLSCDIRCGTFQWTLSVGLGMMVKKWSNRRRCWRLRKEKESVGKFTKRKWISVLELNRDHWFILRWENSETIIFLRRFKI